MRELIMFRFLKGIFYDRWQYRKTFLATPMVNVTETKVCVICNRTDDEIKFALHAYEELPCSTDYSNLDQNEQLESEPVSQRTIEEWRKNDFYKGTNRSSGWDTF